MRCDAKLHTHTFNLKDNLSGNIANILLSVLYNISCHCLYSKYLTCHSRSKLHGALKRIDMGFYFYTEHKRKPLKSSKQEL